MNELNRAILDTWMIYQGEIAPIIDKHRLTPEQVLAFAEDPDVRRIMNAYEELIARRHRIVGMHHQTGAAEALSKTMYETSKPDERRRAASALARLTKDMIQGPPTTKRRPKKLTEGSGLSARSTSSHSSLPSPSPSPAPTLTQPTNKPATKPTSNLASAAGLPKPADLAKDPTKFPGDGPRLPHFFG